MPLRYFASKLTDHSPSDFEYAEGEILGTSELAEGLDLAETMPSVLELIQESIHAALVHSEHSDLNLKNAKIAIVLQSYEFEETRRKFEAFAEKNFHSVMLFPDWQITYWTAFKNNLGISLVIDKGVSCSYLQNGHVKKLGGWKFPVYDLGGENWLGLEAIRHTIEAYEGFVPLTDLARNILARFNGKIEKITETCFKGTKDPDIYRLFSDILLRSYFSGDAKSASIIKGGFALIYRAIDKIDSILKVKPKIVLNGSLTDIYKDFLPQDRLIISPDDAAKASLLADIAKEPLSTN